MSYRPDPDNLRAHPARNKALIRQSLEEVGPFRSIAIDGDGIVRAGNGVYEQAQALGLTIREVEAQPGELIAVRRSDLVGDAARRAAFYDNAASDTSYFDAELLRVAMEQQPQVVGGVLTDDELAGIIEAHQEPIEQIAGIDTIPEQWMVLIECKGEREQAALLEQLSSEGWTCRALTS